MATFQVWQYNGIPVTKPEFKCDNLQELRDWLIEGVYTDPLGNIHGYENEKVFYVTDPDSGEGLEIPLEAIFGKGDFFSTKEWAAVCK
jgi:hypothetical protein